MYFSAEIYRGGKAFVDIVDTDIDSDGPTTFHLMSRLHKGKCYSVTTVFAIIRKTIVLHS